MGTLALLSDYSSPEEIDVFEPVNYRPAEDCVLMIFPEGSRERTLYHFEAIQYCRGELAGDWYYIVEDPETGALGMYWVAFLPGGYCVRDYTGAPSCRKYAKDEVRIVGRAFQFIFSLKSDERIEIIRGPARELAADPRSRPLYDVHEYHG